MANHAVLGLCGSLRKASLNRRLLMQAGRMYTDADFNEASLQLPLYNGDVEAEGIPPEVQALADQIAAADAVIIASPEYNKSLSGVLKNALDWVSRVNGNPWARKPVAIMSATGGRTGGEVAQQALVLALGSFNTRLIGAPKVLVAGAPKEFNEKGELVSDNYVKALGDLMANLRAEVELLS